MPRSAILHDNKGYDSDAIRRHVEGKHRMPDIRPKVNRRWTRNAIERMFCRLKDFRRVATRYDRLAINFLAAVCIPAVVSDPPIGHADPLVRSCALFCDINIGPSENSPAPFRPNPEFL